MLQLLFLTALTAFAALLHQEKLLWINRKHNHIHEQWNYGITMRLWSWCLVWSWCGQGVFGAHSQRLD